MGQERTTLPILEFRKWSGDINVPDPVALSVDDSGRVFVTQTRRRKIQDLDIRQHRHWIPSDLGLRSVDDKSKFFKSVLAIGGDQKTQSTEVQDLNQDGEHDWRDLTVVSEVIYRLTDDDGDGTADTINVFSEDFKTEVTGIAAGVMAYDGMVYATVAPDLWKLGDDDQDGIADSKLSLAHGFGLHIAYAGHDMHGLTVGPDGKIYWSIGDKGINVTTSEGENFSFPDQGGVMRCNPDGSDFEVFAHGLRNVQELAFDQYGNLFGVDNDADQPNEKERFVYIVNQMDAGWRCYYQYRKDNYNPWTAENLWNLPGENHPAYIIPPIRHFIDGPAGFKFNPGTALSPEFKDYFFLTGAPNGGQYAFQVKRSGDSFQMVNDQQIGSGIAIVGLAFGPDGALYGADWDGGYPLDEKGSVVKIDVPPSLYSNARSEVQELLPKEFNRFPAADLIRLLGHQDMRVRLKAQFALVDKSRGDLLSAEARNSSATQLAKLHSVWGLGQLARQGESLARDTLVLAFKDDDPIVRGQAAKTFGEIKQANGTPLLKLLKDSDAYVRTLAALALARHPLESAAKPLLEQAAKLEPNQYYLRHGLACALAACGSAKELANAKENAQQQLVCVLALRKQRSELITGFLDHTDIQIATAAARAIHDDESIAAALPALAECLDTTKYSNDAFLRRSLNANYRLGSEESAERLVQFALSQKHSIELRREALVCLFSWDMPPVLDRVEGIHRPILTSRSALDKNKNVQTLLAQAEPEFREEIIEVALDAKIRLPIQTLAEMVSDEKLKDQIRVSALQDLHQQVENLVAAAADIPQRHCA